MEILLYVSLILIFAGLLAFNRSDGVHKEKRSKNKVYRYTAKSSLMSQAEADFFAKLQHAVQGRYYVFPQVHLSAILDHRVDGQEWRHAFKHINGKSVDYVLCSKVTLEPTYAIELDDYTHNRPNRRERDTEVNRIFKAANLPLVRFVDKNVSDTQIIQTLADAKDALRTSPAS